METKIRNNFLKVLVEKGIIAEDDIQRLSIKFKGEMLDVLSYLVKEGLVGKEKLGQLWGDNIGVAYVNLKKTLFQQEIVSKLPKDFAKKHNVIFIYQFGNTVTAATPYTGDAELIKEIQNVSGMMVSPVFAFPDEIRDSIEIQYQSAEDILKMSLDLNKMSSQANDESVVDMKELERLVGESVVIDFVRNLLLYGLQQKASDIHIEPGEETVRIRYRIDGVLMERFRLDKSILFPIVARLKIIADADIAEKRKPQDGRISVHLSDRSIDFRFSSVPTIYGEKVVLRILGQIHNRSIPDLIDLDFSTTMLERTKKVIQQPNGIFFVTGPTGSGKSTTLYSALKYINEPDINIMTIEDPVEYRLAGINQIQVNHLIGLNFATALRSFLRQDPDVILIGEIRDLETAKIATEAALTGHFVLATMHTNNSIQVMTRLIEIGVEPYMVAPSIVGSMAQRLVRKICNKCKVAYKLTSEEIEKYFIWDGKTDVEFYRGAGCSQCNHTGYSGRIAVHELVVMDNELRDMIARNANTNELEHYIVKNNFESIEYDGLKKVLRGLTTIDEVERVCVTI